MRIVMEDEIFSNHPFITEHEDFDTLTTPDDNIISPESPPSSTLPNDILKLTSSSSPRRSSKRGMQKRVVCVPIKDVDGARLKGETASPPSDSWAWRKYGQKPIKGSPYPRGYYRCSSSKGCPARKQVERSRVDPTMLVVTYSSDHNHSWPPPSRTHHHHRASANAKPEISTPPQPDNPEPEPEDKFADLGDDSLITTADEFGWFGEMETTSSTILESPIFAEEKGEAAVGDVAMFFPMGEEDESLFADLGELPECTAVFRHHRGVVGPEVQIC